MPRYELSLKARADIEALSIYIREQSGALRAEHVVVRIRRALETLASMPRMGHSQHYLWPGVLSFAVRRWVIFYEPYKDGKGINVHRILDGRRDLAALFDGDA